MAIKRAPRKRKELGDLEKEFADAYKKNFDCSNIKMRKPFPLSDNHIIFYHLTQNDRTNMVFLDGPAGSMKSYISVYTAVELLREQKVEQIIYIRSVVESASRSIGLLPGEISDKFMMYSMPLIDKLSEIVDKPTITSLMEQEYIKAIPVNFVRGLTFNSALVIIDEAQNMTRSELTTILTRFGRNTKYIVCGDAKQCDIKDSGFEKIHQLFDTEHSRKNNIHCMKFDTDDVVRSPILKHITSVLGV